MCAATNAHTHTHTTHTHTTHQTTHTHTHTTKCCDSPREAKTKKEDKTNTGIVYQRMLITPWCMEPSCLRMFEHDIVNNSYALLH